MLKEDKVLLIGEILGGILMNLGLCISAELFGLGGIICLGMPIVYGVMTFNK